MPYKNQDKKKEYHRQYMGEYAKSHPLTDEQKKRKAEYMKKWVERNKEKVKETSRVSYQKNKEKRAQRAKVYVAANAAAIKKRKQEYYQENKETFSQKSKEYYSANLPTIRVYKKQYAKTPKGKFLSYQVSAKKRGHEFNLTEESFKQIFLSQCHYCGKEEARGIDRKDSSVGYLPENSLPCCKECNYMKRDMEYHTFLQHIQRIINHINLL